MRIFIFIQGVVRKKRRMNWCLGSRNTTIHSTWKKKQSILGRRRSRFSPCKWVTFRFTNHFFFFFPYFCLIDKHHRVRYSHGCLASPKTGQQKTVDVMSRIYCCITEKNTRSWALMRMPLDAWALLAYLCEGVTYRATGIKDRSITPPWAILVTLSPPSEGRDLWGVGTVYGRTLTHPRFVSIPGKPGRYVLRNTRARVCMEQYFEVRFEPVSCRLRQCALPSEAIGVKYPSITQPRVILVTRTK